MEISYFDTFKKGTFKEIKPVYLLYGKEEKLIEETLEKIVSSSLDIENKELNLDIFEGEAFTTSCLNTLNTLPFMSNRRVSVIKDAEKIQENILERIKDYLKNPSKYTVLVLVSKLSKKSTTHFVGTHGFIINKEIYEMIGKIGLIIRCSFKNEDEQILWIRNKVAKLGKKIEPSALSLLTALAGFDLLQLDMELEKVCSLVGSGNLITKSDIESVVVPRGESTIFNLIDSIGERAGEKALIHLDYLLKRNEPPSKIISMIARQFRLIWQTKFLIESGYLPSEPSFFPKDLNLTAEDEVLLPKKENILQQHSYVKKKCIKQVQFFQESEIQNALEKILSCDLSIKGIRDEKDSRLSLELLLLELCKPRKTSGLLRGKSNMEVKNGDRETNRNN